MLVLNCAHYFCCDGPNYTEWGLFFLRDGVTALLEASRRGHDDTVRALLDVHADVNATTTRVEESALLYATRRGHDACTQLLVSAGADVNLTSRLGERAVFNAVRTGNPDSLEALIQVSAMTCVAGKVEKKPACLIVLHQQGVHWFDLSLKQKVVVRWCFGSLVLHERTT